MNYRKPLLAASLLTLLSVATHADAQPMSECFVVTQDGATIQQCAHTPGQQRLSGAASQTSAFLFANNTSAPIEVGVMRSEGNGYTFSVALDWTLQPGAGLLWTDPTPRNGAYPWLVWCPVGQTPHAGRGAAGYLGYSCGDNYYPLPQ